MAQPPTPYPDQTRSITIRVASGIDCTPPSSGSCTSSVSSCSLNPAITLDSHSESSQGAICATKPFATNILEYGSGGSTLLAARGGACVVSVESDKAWAQNMRKCLSRESLENRARIHYANIGPTRAWGYPEKYSRWRNIHYAAYSRSVWFRPDLRHPSIVLIDGRFRVGCFFYCAYRIKHKTRFIFDDYIGREHYKAVEILSAPNIIIGRMAVFDMEPGMITKQVWQSSRDARLSPA